MSNEVFHEEGVLAMIDHRVRTSVHELWPKDRDLTPIVRELRNYADYLEEVEQRKGGPANPDAASPRSKPARRGSR